MSRVHERPPAGKSEYKKKKEEKEEIDLGRRRVLVFGGALLTTAGIMGPGLIIRKIQEAGERKENSETDTAKIPEKEKIEPKPEPEVRVSVDEMVNAEVEKEQFEYDYGITEYQAEEAKSLKEILDFKSSRSIRLDPEIMEAVKNYWKQGYGGLNPKLYESLVKGYREMGY